jgi:hypothetical protein
MSANLLIVWMSNFRDFSECALINRENHLDFDSAIPRFESWRPSQCQSAEFFAETVLFSRGYLAHLEKWIPL